MPLFGKKKPDSSDEKKKGYPTQSRGGYPQQTAAYPVAPQIQAQQAYQTNTAPPGAAAAQGIGAPPPYAPPGQVPGTQQACYAPQQAGYAPQQAGYAPQQAGYAPPGGVYPAPYAQPGYAAQGPPAGSNTTYVVQGGFDAGARFDGSSPPSIPPPPPGCAPNVAQVAASQGSNVQITQREGNWMTGGSDGGYTIW